MPTVMLMWKQNATLGGHFLRGLGVIWFTISQKVNFY